MTTHLVYESNKLPKKIMYESLKIEVQPSLDNVDESGGIGRLTV